MNARLGGRFRFLLCFWYCVIEHCSGVSDFVRIFMCFQVSISGIVLCCCLLRLVLSASSGDSCGRDHDSLCKTVETKSHTICNPWRQIVAM